ncbi:unnamed protein product [marine sediment metagenome]|uniref:Uncharacterized protein n=1 Tax=marine sediment metagenome TaxID=412755 RepID=X0SYP3_9ZZZZ
MHQKDKVFQIGELRTIISSQVLRRILSQRKGYLQTRVNMYVREQNLASAYGTLCKLDDVDKFVDIIQAEYEKLTKEK